MLDIRRRGAIVVLAVMLTCLAAEVPSAGAAATQGSIACAVTGRADASILWGPVPVVQPPAPHNGNYTFTELEFDCVVQIDNPSSETRSLDLVNIDVTSTGTFTTSNCGSGSAADPDPTINVNSLLPGGNPVHEGDDLIRHIDANGGFGYQLDIIGGVAVLRFDSSLIGRDPGNGILALQPDPLGGVDIPSPTSFCSHSVLVEGGGLATTRTL